MNSFLTNSQYAFIQSKNRSSGETCDFSIDFPTTYIECEDDEIMSITLLNFNCFTSWYVVNETNDTFTLTRVADNVSTQITLETGNYPYKVLYQRINNLFGSNICSWDKIQNKFVFTFDTTYNLSFDNNSYEVLGFDDKVYTGNIIKSDYILSPVRNLDNICLHLYGVQPYKSYNLDNIQSEKMKISNLMMAMPFMSAPYDIFNYTNVNSEYTLYFYDKSITQLRFLLTDTDGNPISYLPDFTMTLKIETHQLKDEDELLQATQKILEYTKLNFLNEQLKNQN